MTHSNANPKHNDNIDLSWSPALERLQTNLRDLLIISHEGCTKTPGNSLRLSTLLYVSGEKCEDRYSMHFAGQIKDLDRNVNTPVALTFTVNIGEPKCSES